MTLLNDAEWATWNDREIARQCAVEHHMVGRMRPALPSGALPQIERTVSRGGTTYPMNTAKIGGNQGHRDEIGYWRNLATERGIAYVSTQPDADPRAGAPDMSMSHLWRSLRDVVETINRMPEPAETADQFPTALEHALRAEDVTAAAEWLSEFAALWAPGQQIRDERTAALVARAKELMGHVEA